MCFSEFPQNFLYFIHQHLVVSPENSNVHLAYLFITQKKIMCFKDYHHLPSFLISSFYSEDTEMLQVRKKRARASLAAQG